MKTIELANKKTKSITISYQILTTVLIFIAVIAFGYCHFMNDPGPTIFGYEFQDDDYFFVGAFSSFIGLVSSFHSIYVIRNSTFAIIDALLGKELLQLRN